METGKKILEYTQSGDATFSIYYVNNNEFVKLYVGDTFDATERYAIRESRSFVRGILIFNGDKPVFNKFKAAYSNGVAVTEEYVQGIDSILTSYAPSLGLGVHTNEI